MGHAHPQGDHGYRVGLEASAVGFAAASLLAAGHAHAVDGVRRQREAREQAAHDAAVAHRLDNAARLEAWSERLAAELAEARAENLRLKRQLAQKQAYIDGLRRSV